MYVLYSWMAGGIFTSRLDGSLDLRLMVSGDMFPSVKFIVFHIWDMSVPIQRCENFGLFYRFCSQLVVVSEHQT